MCVVHVRAEPGEREGLRLGLITILEVRAVITSYEDPGWYQNPPGTVARKVEASTQAAPPAPTAAPAPAPATPKR